MSKAARTDIRPFLPIARPQIRPLGGAIPTVASAPVTAPWLPGRAAPVPPPAPAAAAVAAAPPAPAPIAIAPPPAGPSADELAAIYDEARDRGLDDGRAEGLAATAALRAQLTAVLDQLDAARASIVPPSAEMIAEVATCVVETWIGNIYPGLTFAPIVQSWLAHAADQPTTVRVHPDDAAALAEAIGGAPLTIAPDRALARGTLALTSGTRELVHDFTARLGDLRTLIVTALTGVDE